MTLPFSGFRIIVMLILFPVVAWLILFFFGKLTGFSMFSAVAWSFKLTSLRALPIVGIIIYLSAYSMFFIFFQIPVQVFEINKNNIGGLHGYMDHGLQSVIYDPVENRYIKYPQLSPSLPVAKFTDLFDVEVLYKASTSEYYNSTAPMRLPAILMEIIIGSLMILILYIILFNIAIGYNDGEPLTHRLIASRFHDVTGLSPLKALIVFIVLITVISLAGIISVKRITDNYKEKYSVHRERLRGMLLKKVSPGDSVTGTVIRRFQGYESETEITEGAGGKVRSKNIYYTVLHYTVEFRDLINIPVYLDISYREGSVPAPEPDRLFKESKAYMPERPGDFTFTVNDDYSISFKKSKSR